MKLPLLRLAAAGAALSLLAGCIVLSVYPFYNSKDLVFDPGLVGRWVKAGDANEWWMFRPLAGKSYSLTTVDSQDTNTFEAHLFQLKQFQFMDLLTTNRDEFALPVHLISKVNQGESKISMQFLDYGWLAGLLETNPAVLRHIIVPEKPGDTNSGQMLYLTAETKDLQRFLLKHAEDENAFNSNSAVELMRAAAQ